MLLVHKDLHDFQTNVTKYKYCNATKTKMETYNLKDEEEVKQFGKAFMYVG